MIVHHNYIPAVCGSEVHIPFVSRGYQEPSMELMWFTTIDAVPSDTESDRDGVS